MTQVLGEAALNNEAHFIQKRNEIIEIREYTKKRLEDLGFTLTNSKANFLFCKHPDISGYELYSKLKNMGILIRQWNKPRILDYVRITIGTRAQMDALFTAVRSIINEKR
jgi:histidinol-phosphate aminotransferase